MQYSYRSRGIMFSVCPSRCPDVSPSRAIAISFALQEYWTDFDEFATNRLNDDILSKVVTATSEQDTAQNSNRCQPCCRNDKQWQTPSEWTIHKFHSTYQCRCDRGHNFTLIHLQILYKNTTNSKSILFPFTRQLSNVFNSQHGHLHSFVGSLCHSAVWLALEDCGYTRTRWFTRPHPYPRVRVGSGTCSTGTGWVG